jgi:transcriptional regulator with XRE-family HTH domain
MGERGLGERLRAIRRAHRVTGASLAQRLGVTQGTVSKMETGTLTPDIDYLARFAHFLRLDPSQAAELMKLAGAIPQGSTPESFLRFVPCDFVTLNWAERRQEAARQAEERSRHIRVFQPLLVPGLLQTEAYARNVFLRAGSEGGVAVDRAVRSRLRRQRVLADRERRNIFVITEAALRCRLAPVDVLAAQYAHLGEIITDGRVRIGIIPVDASPPVPYPPAFYVFDDRVYIELPHGDLWLLNSSNTLGTYENLFSTLLDIALFDAPAQRLLARLSRNLLAN